MGELVGKKPLNLKITLTFANGETEELKGEYLLAAVANAKWYGGGFKVAPLADVADGLLDVVLVKNVSRTTFIKIVGDFKSGKLVDEKGVPVDKVKDFLRYERCTSVRIEGCEAFCADGEIFKESQVEISVIPKALNYIK